MTEKRFIDDGYEAIEEQSFTDTETDKTYYVDYFDEIIDLANGLNEKNKVLYKEIERLRTQNKDLLYSNAKNIELLEKENKDLKAKYNSCIEEMDSLAEVNDKFYNENKKLKEKNEQLKSDNNRLVNETAKVVAEHQKRVLDLIDEKIKEADIRECDCCRNCVADQLLSELKKELQE